MNDGVVVVGASGFGRETLDVLEAMQAAGASLEIVGVVDDGPSATNIQRLAEREISYLGRLDEWLAAPSQHQTFLLAIGNPHVRRRLATRIEAAGLQPFTAVHPSATIGSRASIAPGTVICAGVAVSTNVQLGRHVHVNPNATVGHDTILNDFVSLNPGSVISGEVTIGAGVLVGAGATVLQQLEVGADTTIGAAALVTKNVPEMVTVKGLPGRWDSNV